MKKLIIKIINLKMPYLLKKSVKNKNKKIKKS